MRHSKRYSGLAPKPYNVPLNPLRWGAGPRQREVACQSAKSAEMLGLWIPVTRILVTQVVVQVMEKAMDGFVYVMV